MHRAIAAAALLSALALAAAAPAHDVARSGTSGYDVLVGHRHRDVFRGLGGNDELYGRGGPDALFGGRGWDLVAGGRGTDVLAGGRGVDALYGGRGDDVILAQGEGEDFGDVVVCGPGHDIAWIDVSAETGARDYTRGCEDVRW
ncbi:MAG: hypothetical protein M3312_03230 [Actinomycetota bacterium]|nr:hypothetical protein [Actinomycetota bacterium]